MKKSLILAVALLLFLFSTTGGTSAQTPGAPTINVSSQFFVSSYGFAVMNETVTFNNTGTTAVQIPSLQLGFPASVASRLVGNYTLTGTGYTVSASTSNGSISYAVSSSLGQLQAGASSAFSLKAVMQNLVSLVNGSTVGVLLVGYPSVNVKVDSLKSTIQMPSLASLATPPAGYTPVSGSGVPVYRISLTEFGPGPALVTTAALQASGASALTPVHVFVASRTITATGNGKPQIQDYVNLKNTGTSAISSLKLALLLGNTGQVTVVSNGYPPLLNPKIVGLSNGAIDLTAAPFSSSLKAGSNLTVTMVYDLPSTYFSVSGGQISVNIPTKPPIAAPVDTYTISMSLPTGIRSGQGQPQVFQPALPLAQGTASLSYSITLGFAADRAIPAASVVFLIVLIGLYVSRAKTGGAEEEGTISEQAADMIKAFEEKTDLVNSMFDQIRAEEASNLNKAYFDEIRQRIGTFRGRALQRLNEAKQKSSSKPFLDLLVHINEVEKEVDRATKDLLNLYEQYYTKRMRQETFENLLPNYRKRYDASLNHLSDQLNLAQKEAKLQ
ncbi:MAG: CHASE3 domain-containing protein [Thaumarchaeota archaeon]|nr:CHASE3 domain-containing protein [Nitrososphaerota archaeon]